MRNPELDVVKTELENNGVRFSIDDQGGPHIKVRWWHRGKPRVIVCGRSASDHRAAANNRALVRRTLREDGYDIDAAPKPAPKVTSLKHVLSVPTPTDTTPERLTRLETQLATITDLLMDIAPAFDTALDDVRNMPAKLTECVVTLAALSPKRLGLALAALYTAGFTPQEVDVQFVGGEVKPQQPHEKVMLSSEMKPQPKVSKHTEQMKGRRREDVIQVLAQKPLTTRELIEACSVAKDRESAFSQMIHNMKVEKLITHDGKGAPWQLTPQASNGVHVNGANGHSNGHSNGATLNGH
jgi:hypothetical protein